jgi:putative transcription factor
VSFTLRCEVCGHKIHSDPIKAIIEGARLTVCVECAKHGKIVFEDVPFERKTVGTFGAAVASKKPSGPVALVQKKTMVPRVDITKELIEGYESKIRFAREKLGFSHEDLGLKINEKASVLRHLETGKMAPNNLLASKLERALKITLLVPIAEEKPSAELPKSAANQEFTLGDLIEFDKKAEEPSKRK